MSVINGKLKWKKDIRSSSLNKRLNKNDPFWPKFDKEVDKIKRRQARKNLVREERNRQFFYECAKHEFKIWFILITIIVIGIIVLNHI